MSISTIQKIFTDNDYKIHIEVIETGEYLHFLAQPQEASNRKEYFLVIENKSLNDDILKKLIEEDSIMFYDELKNSNHTDETFRKNSTLVLLSSEKVSDDLIYQFEEDPFNFKKTYIPYTINTIRDLSKKTGADFKNENLNKLVNEAGGDVFRNFKKGHSNEENYYSLLLKIMTRLPFLKYQPADEDLVNLKSEIEKDLDKKDPHLVNVINELMSVDVEDIMKDTGKLESFLLKEWG